MSEDTTLIAELRECKGTASSRNIRRGGNIPGIVYNSKTETDCIQLNQHNFEMMLRHHKSEHLILDLKIGDGKARKVLLKDVQHHPVSDVVLHADFMEISMTEKMIVPIRLELKGEPVGVKTGGGVLEHMVREIEVECLPTDLVESIDVDVSAMDIGDTLLARDMIIDSKFAIVTAGEVAIAMVAAPKVEAVDDEEVEGEEGAEAGAEGTEEKKEEASGDSDKE